MRTLLNSWMWLLPRSLRESWIINRYIRAGAIVGDADSYFFMGKAVGYDWDLDRWIFWEKQIIKLGYQPLSLDTFIKIVGYGAEVPELPLLNKWLKPIRHAQIRKSQLEGTSPKYESVRIGRGRDGKSFSGSYTLPSTEK